MKLAMYKGEGNIYDKLIRNITFSQYSHCELVIEGLCYSSSPRDRGVRMKYIVLDGNWDVFELPCTYNQVSALEMFTTHVGKKYDWIGAITSILPIQLNMSNRFFCSEICASMLGMPKPRSHTPQSVLDSVSK